MSDWIDPAILAPFVPTFFFVSVTPGMCMTLAMTLGMSLGVRRTLHMMWGELVGVGLVSVLSVVGVIVVGNLLYGAVFAPHLATKLAGWVTSGPTVQLFPGVPNQPLHG